MVKLANLNRWQAAGSHLALSALIGAIVLAAMIFVWYPPPYFEAAGGNDLVLLMVGIDVALGPLLTLAVFNPGKGMGKLRLDLAIIGFAADRGARLWRVRHVHRARRRTSSMRSTASIW